MKEPSKDAPQRVEPGPVSDRLRPCPGSPNCVCSEYPDDDHSIEPLTIAGSPDEAWDRLLRILDEQPRTTIITRSNEYLLAHVRTRVFRFLDELEFRLDRPGRMIHVRSASRIGYSDLGTNRKRVEAIRKRFLEE